MKLNRDKIIAELRKLPDVYQHSECYLSYKMGMDYAKYYWNNVRDDWTEEEVTKLAETMAEITKRPMQGWEVWVR